MKSLLCLFLFIALASTQSVPIGIWKDVDPADVTKSNLIKQYLDIGVSQYIRRAFEAGELTTTDLKVGLIYSCATQLSNGFSVKFNLELIEGNGKASHGVALVVFSPPGASTKKLTSSKLIYTSASKWALNLENGIYSGNNKKRIY